MRICILAFNLRVAGGLSVGKSIVRSLSSVESGHSFLVFVPKGLDYEMHETADNIRIQEVDCSSIFKRLLFERIQLPRYVNQYAPDYIWGLGNYGLVNPPCKQAILFHKSHLVYPREYYKSEVLTARFKNWLLKVRLKKCLPKTDIVFCQTPVVLDRFSKTFSYPAEKMRILPNSVSFAVVEQESKQLEPKDKESFVLFYLTKYYAHKNLEILIDLFRDHSKELQGVKCVITIDASQHPKAQKFLNRIREERLEHSIVNVGPVEQAELHNYFRRSDALFFPSLLESFSGTYLEAMHFEVPILTSDLDFARHICGDAALYFDPRNTASIVEKVHLLQRSSTLREQLKQLGSHRLDSLFSSWEDVTNNAVKNLVRSTGV